MKKHKDVVFDGMSGAAISLASRMGWPLNEHDRAVLMECHNLDETMARLTESVFLQKLFLVGNTMGQGRLGEFYTALLTGGYWDPQPGFDLHMSVRLPGTLDVEGVRVEVRTSGWTAKSKGWQPKITGDMLSIGYDVLVVVGLLKNSYNPATGKLFVIPKDILEPRIEGKNYTAHFHISRNRESNHRGGGINQFWEYHLANHAELRKRISQYASGDIFVFPQQLEFDF